MRSTQARSTTGAVVAALVGALVLAACGDREVDDALPAPGPPATEQAVPEPDTGAAAAQEQVTRLRELRRLYPTAGTEVPPDTLRAGGSGGGTGGHATGGGADPLRLRAE